MIIEKVIPTDFPIEPMSRAILFSGDRWSCCDQCVYLYVSNKLVAIATIAPNGEQNSGNPEIVGIYVHKEYRNLGYSKLILEGAVNMCKERGFPYVNITVVNSLLLNPAKSISDISDGYLRVTNLTNFITDMVLK